MHLRVKRRGVVLLITLAIIAVMITLIGVFFGYLSDARGIAKDESAMIEADLLRDEFNTFFNKNLKGKDSKEFLKTLYTTPLSLSKKDGGFSLTLLCKPSLTKIPINWLIKSKDKISKARYNLVYQIFDRITQDANLKEPQELFRMIQDAILGKRFQLNGKKMALSLEAFKDVLDNYRFKFDDKNVYRVDWEEYFSFGSNRLDLLGLNRDYLSPKLISIIFNLDLTLVKEDYKDGELQSFLKQNGIDIGSYDWLFNKNSLIAFSCNSYYQDGFDITRYNIKFEYIVSRIDNFEYYKE